MQVLAFVCQAYSFKYSQLSQKGSEMFQLGGSVTHLLMLGEPTLFWKLSLEVVLFMYPLDSLFGLLIPRSTFDL